MDFGPEIVGLIKKEFLEIIKRIERERPDLFNNPQFSVWVTATLADLFCSSGKALGVKKDTLIKMVDEAWDFLSSSKNILN